MDINYLISKEQNEGIRSKVKIITVKNNIILLCNGDTQSHSYSPLLLVQVFLFSGRKLALALHHQQQQPVTEKTK